MRGEDALGRDHPVDVVGGRLPADENHVLAGAALDRGIGVEDHVPAGCPGRRVEALRDHVHARARVDHRVQELIELVGIDARDGVLARDQALLDHVHGGLQRGCGGPLRASGLEQVEPVVLDRELDVLHVSVVLLEPAHRVDQLLERVGQRLLHLRERQRRADSGDDVLALGIGEKLSVQTGLARGRVAREGDAGAGALALVPEHHLDDADRGAEVVGDVVRLAVDLGARVAPRVEDGAHRPRELIPARPAGTGCPSPPGRSP